jgi:flagellar biosynthesis regulator FlbT
MSAAIAGAVISGRRRIFDTRLLTRVRFRRRRAIVKPNTSSTPIVSTVYARDT